MTGTLPQTEKTGRKLTVGSPMIIWAAFIIVHLWLELLNLKAPGLPLGDVQQVYSYWAQEANYAGFYVGIDSPWVYPILALVPILEAGVFGFTHYAITWLTMVFLLDAIAFGILVGWGRDSRSTRVGWWWIAFLLLLGPIAMGRIDSITIPVGIVAVLFLATRPRSAAVLLTIAAWIKVWPIAIIAAVLVATRHRLRVLISAVATTVVIIVAALALGAGANVFSFVTQQTGRSLQVEAPISTIWMWLARLHVGDSAVYFDPPINTYEVKGPGESIAASLMNPILAIALLAVAIVGYLAVRRGAPVTEMLPNLALAFTTSLIAFNKVGSPQYITWISVPIVLGLAVHATGHGRSFRTPAIIALVIAGLTQAIYPYVYYQLLALNGALLVMLSLRNVLLFVLLGWAMRQVWKLSRPGVVHEQLPETDNWLPATWPRRPLRQSS